MAIIDIGLPGIDGYEIGKRMRERPNGRAMLLLASPDTAFRATTNDRPRPDSIITPLSRLTHRSSRSCSARGLARPQELRANSSLPR